MVNQISIKAKSPVTRIAISRSDDGALVCSINRNIRKLRWQGFYHYAQV